VPEAATESHSGRIITFYSYTGGTGRTMALANIAWILAANGHRVLIADWSLESPGLHQFLFPFLERVIRDAHGVIDLIRDYERVAARSNDEDRERHIAEHARVQRYSFSLDWKFPNGGCLDFLSPGRQNTNYLATLSALDWDTFYETLDGGKFLDAVREEMRRHYDYVLIDSRAGLGDIADICTVHLPDVLVDCFLLSTQSIEGAVQVARVIGGQYRVRSIRVLPVPMRVDSTERERAEAGRTFAVQRFAGLPAGMSVAERREYWAGVEVPYRSFYAFEEVLAVFCDTPGVPTSLLAAFERIAAYITDGVVTGLPPMDDEVRNRVRQLFVRGPAKVRQLREYRLVERRTPTSRRTRPGAGLMRGIPYPGQDFRQDLHRVEVGSVWLDLGFDHGPRDLAGQPVCVSNRREYVLGSMPEQHGRLDDR
jgi:hypothetical protein